MARKQRYQWDVGAAEDQGERPSRSQKKRDSTALQDLGEELVRLPLTRLADMPLTPDLDEALRLMAKISDHEGRRRQMQYIGRLMRECDASALREALDQLRQGHNKDNALFHHAEQLREALLLADPAEEERLLAPWPEAAEQMRSLLRQARSEKSPQAKRQLFRLLRQALGER